jgi:predicted dehydrogenase
MTNPVRVAAIGVGHWHSLFDAAYLKALVRMPAARLIAIHDPDSTAVAQRAAELGNPPTFTDHRAMLEKMRPDFVIVLGRHCDMAAAAHDLLDEGFPFLVEKPVGINAAEVRSVAEKAAAKHAFAGVPLFQRLQPFVSHARAMLADGAFGPVSHFYFRSNRPTSGRYVAWGAPWMLDPAIAGGGCLRNVGLHGIDAFLFLTGDGAQVTGVQTSARALGERVEDYASVLLRSADGVLGTVEVGNTFPGQGGDAEWRLSGRDALLTLRGGTLRCVTRSGEREIPGEATEQLSVLALRDALARWQRGEPPAVGIDAAYRAMQVVDDAYALARENGTLPV